MANAIVTSQTVIFLMKISPISKLDEVMSPEVIIYGIPWEAEAIKHEGENSLAVYLHCLKQDDSSSWSVPAHTTIKLTCYGDDKNALEYHIEPHAFHASSLSFGYGSFIRWDELLKDENKYVQDDTIELKIEITAEDPNFVNRSILNFESIDKSCDCGSHATYRLTVTNIKHLMAARSVQFIVRNLTWYLEVYKSHPADLGIVLLPVKTLKDVPCNMKMSVKLLSSKTVVDFIKKTKTDKIQWPNNLRMSNIISWDELLKPENGYVNNDSITLEVKIKAKKADGDVDPHNSAKRGRFECSVCLEEWGDHDMSLTACGHPFCTACITEIIEDRGACPLCNEPVQLNDLRHMYLPDGK